MENESKDANMCSLTKWSSKLPFESRNKQTKQVTMPLLDLLVYIYYMIKLNKASHQSSNPSLVSLEDLHTQKFAETNTIISEVISREASEDLNIMIRQA